MKDDKILSNLVLATILLSSWEEDIAGEKVLRAWKGYPFEILDSLEDAGLISQSRKAKSLYLTEEGKETAKRLLKAYHEKTG